MENYFLLLMPEPNTPLQRGEEIKHHYSPALKSSLGAGMFTGAIMFLVGLPALFLGSIDIGLILIFLGLSGVFGPPITAKFTNYYVTSQRIIKEYTFLVSKTKVIRYNRITHIAPKSGILDRIFGAGTIRVKTAGTGSTDLNIKHIYNWKEAEKDISRSMNQGNFNNAAAGGAQQPQANNMRQAQNPPNNNVNRQNQRGRQNFNRQNNTRNNGNQGY